MTHEEQFEHFWAAYPRRISKGAARKAFAKAIGKTTLDRMIKAIAAYIANKPGYQDFKHPATWLNSECWDDEWNINPAHQQPTGMDGFMASRRDSRNERTLDAEFTRGSDRRSAPFALENPSFERRH